jgi:membrane protease YdiL (CAAX protease family)
MQHSQPVNLKIFFLSFCIVLIGEILTSTITYIFSYPPIHAIIIERFIISIILLLLIHIFCNQGLTVIGIDKKTILIGLQRGFFWSIATGFFVLTGGITLYLFNISPLSLIYTSLPHETDKLIIFFLAGGLIGPLAEEIFFRGIVFGFLRKWGRVIAIAGSTLFFVIAHNMVSGAIPFTQLIGGILFATSYEVEKNLIVPVTIHATGNSAIFFLCLLNNT